MSDFYNSVLYSLEKRVANVPKTTSLRNRFKLSEESSSETAVGSVMDHSLWDKILKTYVHSNQTLGSIQECTVVDYKGLSNDPSFTEYLDLLAKVDVDSLKRSEQLALWMNAYNALCINLIIQGRSDLKSINDLSTTETKVWDQNAGVVGGVSVTLNQIEHEQLRGKWDEPSLHACIVCASASCPNLRREAFVGSRLIEQMSSQMKEWLAHPTKGLSFQNNDGHIWISRIFLWFADDFGNNTSPFKNASREKKFRPWLAKYLDDESKAMLLKTRRDAFRYFAYDWTLNRWDREH